MFSPQALSKCCISNNLELNTRKTKEMITDFRQKKSGPDPLLIYGDEVVWVSTFKFLGINVSEDLSWTENTMAIVKKLQQTLHFLKVLRKNNL